MHHLFGTENDRQGPGASWELGDLVEIPPPLEGNAVEIQIAETATLIERGISFF